MTSLATEGRESERGTNYRFNNSIELTLFIGKLYYNFSITV